MVNNILKMKHLSQAIVLVSLVALGSALITSQLGVENSIQKTQKGKFAAILDKNRERKDDQVIDTYENTKIIHGYTHGSSYYPNTELFPVGGRLYGASFSVGQNIDRIDWDIVDAK